MKSRQHQSKARANTFKLIVLFIACLAFVVTSIYGSIKLAVYVDQQVSLLYADYPSSGYRSRYRYRRETTRYLEEIQAYTGEIEVPGNVRIQNQSMFEILDGVVECQKFLVTYSVESLGRDLSKYLYVRTGDGIFIDYDRAKQDPEFSNQCLVVQKNNRT